METSAADYGSQDVAVITDALGDATTYQVNQVGIETFQESPLGAIQSWDVNSAGETTLYVDENGLSTSYGYDNFGDMTEEVDPDGSTTSYTYDATCHEVTLEIDDPADGRLSTTTNGYDESNGEITASITDPGTSASATTIYEWSGGVMTEMIDPDGNYTIDEYDGYNRLTLADEYNSSSTLVNYQSYTYDAIGNPSVTYTADSRTTDLYNDQGQLTSELVYDVGTLSTTMVSSSDTTYLASGLVATSTDGDGNVTSNTYDQVGRLTDVEVLDASTSVISNVTSEYDLASRMTLQIDAVSTTTSYGYDADGNTTFQETLDASHNPVAESRSGYNADDELTSSTDGYGNVTKYGYSSGLQTSQATYASADLSSPISSETWAYDTARDNTLAIDAAGERNQFALRRRSSPDIPGRL